MNPVPTDLSILTVPVPTAELPRAEPDVIELALLLPRWQVEALETVARDHGVSVGTLIRRCLGELLRR